MLTNRREEMVNGDKTIPLSTTNQLFHSSLSKEINIMIIIIIIITVIAFSSALDPTLASLNAGFVCLDAFVYVFTINSAIRA